MHIPFDGIPFILLSTREYQCHQGKVKTLKKKKLIIEKINARNYAKTTLNTLKRGNCLNQPNNSIALSGFKFKKNYIYSKFAIIKDTKYMSIRKH